LFRLPAKIYQASLSWQLPVQKGEVGSGCQHPIKTMETKKYPEILPDLRVPAACGERWQL
jgi:hypothetical protein